jgi:hypothetical protein
MTSSLKPLCYPSATSLLPLRYISAAPPASRPHPTIFLRLLSTSKPIKVGRFRMTAMTSVTPMAAR